MLEKCRVTYCGKHFLETTDRDYESQFILGYKSGENGAYPPTRSGSIHPLLGLKSAWKRLEKRSISVQYRWKRRKTPEKTEHCRSLVARVVFLIPKSYRKRSIAVHSGKWKSLLSSNLRPKNGAYPFIFFDEWRSRVHKTEHCRSLFYSFLRYLYVETNLTYNIYDHGRKDKGNEPD